MQTQTARKTLKFTTTHGERELIEQIAARAVQMMKAHRHAKEMRTRTEVEMDLCATHASGNPLRLADLLAANDFNFAHDVFGIERHLDRDTGQLLDFFSPRFSRRQPDAA